MGVRMERRGRHGPGRHRPEGPQWAEGGSSPLSVAVAEQDARVLDMVGDAVRQRRLRLAYQPVVVAGDPSQLTTDLGPVIDAEAKSGIEQHIETMR